MNKQFSIKILSLEITLQFRTSKQTRQFDAIKIDEAKKQKMLDELDLTALQAKARAARLAFNSEN